MKDPIGEKKPMPGAPIWERLWNAHKGRMNCKDSQKSWD